MGLVHIIALVAGFAVAYEAAEYLRRRAGAEVLVPMWSRLLTVALAALFFVTHAVSFGVAGGLVAGSIALSQVQTWLATRRAARTVERPRLLWVAAALESTGFAAVFAVGLLLRMRAP